MEAGGAANHRHSASDCSIVLVWFDWVDVIVTTTTTLVVRADEVHINLR